MTSNNAARAVTYLTEGWGPYLKTHRAKKAATGRCLWCSQPRLEPYAVCARCHRRRNETRRRRMGFKAWVPGGRGRPPKVVIP